LTPNGKIDRKALPAPDQSRPELEKSFVAPLTADEEKMAKIWGQILKLERVGIHDNFFELGGHSLLVVRVLGEIKKTWGEPLSVATLFQAPTVEQLCKLLNTDNASDHWRTLVPLNPGGTTPPLFSVWLGIATELRALARHLGPEQRFYGLNSHWDPKIFAVTRIEQMAAYCLADLRAVQPHGPYYLSSDCGVSLVALEIAQQLFELGEHVAMLVLIDPYAPNALVKTERRRAGPASSRRDQPRAARRYLDWLARHLRGFGNMSTYDRLAYVSVRLRDRARNLAEATGSKICSSCRIAPPYWVLPRYMVDLHVRAEKYYVPRAYPGKISLIWGTENTEPAEIEQSQKAWAEIAAETANYTIPHMHHELFLEPHVKLLAEKIRICLHEARTVNTGQAVAVASAAASILA
ncbi:MAG: hypothetical protein H7X91_07830, partial [Burkholderiales bacterium]|nr:hypothetical protein [Burkholderiales bacterium]